MARESLIQTLVSSARRLEPEMIGRLAALVRIESPSDDRNAVNQAISQVAQWSKELGGRVKLHRHPGYGNSIEVRFGSRLSDEDPVLLLGHLDTVWEKGTLERMPWKVTRERIYGPGVLDMKGGVIMALTALKILTEQKARSGPAVLLLHGDEEMGSHASRSLTESIARACRAVFVLEPAQGVSGAYKTARKGVGQVRLTVHGVSAHSGVDFERGHSAVTELAFQIEVIHRFTDLKRGITVNPGVIGGGTRSNVVAAKAWVDVDFRIARDRDSKRVERAFRSLHARDEGCRLELTGGLNRPPMERSAGTKALFRRARAWAERMGIPLEEAATGGGSDGNFTAALGIPTLDGMGVVGAGAHAPDEHLLREHLVPRTALLAAMLQDSGAGPPGRESVMRGRV